MRYWAILEGLGRFGYLTPQQIARLGIYSDKGSLYAALRALRKQGLIRGTDPWAVPGEGRLPAVYALTKRGAKVIGSADFYRVKPLRGAREGVPTIDVQHRTGIVDCHIALRACAEKAGFEVARFTADFEPSGAKGVKATAISTKDFGTYVPDAIAVVKSPDGVLRPLVFEVYRGGVRRSASYMRAKVPADLKAFFTIELRDAVRKGVEGRFAAARLLFVTADAKLLSRLLENPPEPSLEGWRYAYAKPLSDVIEGDFLADWRRVDGSRVNLFDAM